MRERADVESDVREVEVAFLLVISFTFLRVVLCVWEVSGILAALKWESLPFHFAQSRTPDEVIS